MPDIDPREWAKMGARNPDDFEISSGPRPRHREDSEGWRGVPAAEIVERHLRARKQNLIEEDLTNFSVDVLILTRQGTYHGHEGLRRFWRDLDDDLPAARFSYADPRAEGRAAMVEWQARGKNTYVEDGVDTYVVEGSRIAVYSVHYTVRHPT